MDDITRLPTTACADLERLAAAAVSMGYTSETISLPGHHISPAVPPCTIAAAPTIVPAQYTDPYDLSRHHYTVARLSADYQSRGVYEQPRVNHSVVQQQQQQPQTQVLPTAHTSRPATHFASDRSGNNFSNGIEARHPTFPASGSAGSANPSVVTNIQYVDTARSDAGTAHPIQPSSEGHSVLEISTTTTGTTSIVTFVQDGIMYEQADKKKVKKKTDISEVKEKKKKKVECEENMEELKDSEAKLDLPDIPEPVVIGGKKYYCCSQCDEKFIRKYVFRRHQVSHTGEKRGALSLERKIQIIQRIQAGEKQVDLAMEFNVGRSTLSFIMKHAEKFLAVWKDKKFHPDSKRLRGAQREDVEEALYEWYKQATEMHLPVSGPLLCQKAKAFAAKLGYKEFKATHGWLDRFKHRKNIVLGRVKTSKDKEAHEEVDDAKGDFVGQVLPNVLMDYEANDIFHADETGLLYRILPNRSQSFRGNRCAGGKHSKHRVTVLMCANMTGTEKFPLLVIGKHLKPKCFKNVKSLPVQYLANSKAWMTSESFTAWLHDLDAWFVQQSRRVLLVIPSLPVHYKTPKLQAVRVLISPPTFIGPCKLGLVHSLKRNYRRAVLETLLNHMEREAIKTNKKKAKKMTMKLNLLSALHLLAAAWHAVTDVNINNCFQRCGIGKYCLWNMNMMSDANLGTENLDLLHKLRSQGFKMPDEMTFDDFVTFDDDVQVCHLMDDDDIIASITGADVESSDSEEEIEEEKLTKVKKEDTKGSPETPKEDSVSGPTSQQVEESLNTLRKHIQFQEGAQDMFRVLAQLEYLIYKGSGKTNTGSVAIALS